MPTLVRLLTTLLAIAAVIYGIMAALVYFVHPVRRETQIEVPLPAFEAPKPGPEAEAPATDGTDKKDGGTVMLPGPSGGIDLGQANGADDDDRSTKR